MDTYIPYNPPLSSIYSLLYLHFISPNNTLLTLSISQLKANNLLNLIKIKPWQKEGAKPEAEKKPAADAGAKKDDGVITAVYKIDMHCEGCAKKIKRSIKHSEGVEDVQTDSRANKLTVIGKIDPAKIRERLAEKTKKKVDLISPQPKKDAAPAGGDKKPEAEKKPEEKKEEKKAPKESTVVLKMRTHCDGCIHKIRKIILKLDGVQSVDVDGVKDLVTVKGTMAAKDLVPYLKQKLRRNVDVVPPTKDVAGEKKDVGVENKEKVKEAVEGGGEKKEDVGEKKEAGGGGEAKMEVSKMEYHGYEYQPQPMYWSNGHVYGDPGYAVEGYQDHHHDYRYVNPGYMLPHPGYLSQGYAIDPRHPLHAPQVFSDENPNACSVM
ncbi:heavy metal-associated isoprenylated plant protein 6-like isoform X1 [Hibiscus syriacus]|uniref:heavy metal-associated isoprenylated plant protein 6-like isoform X1 n=1 Tax=Hibiscus syriacus TaxID=106335 RepID=UPI001925094B|nr:heavy metal-associated isoprenylated plant protein 6-like isoform X1 [Hibiscus syriacus]